MACAYTIDLRDRAAVAALAPPEPPHVTRLWRAFAKRWVRLTRRWETTYRAPLARSAQHAQRRFDRAQKRARRASR